MLQPKNSKYTKCHKSKTKGILNMFINFGSFAIVSMESGRITSFQIESTRRVITKILKKESKIWIRIFPDKPFTKKPLEVRMGKGKGNLEYWVSFIKPGSILYEIDNVDEKLANKSCKHASFKLPIKIILMKKRLYEI
ncbi:50S ribosomal protein L16 [endosymbiont of Euscepes postfasciatus]|uniref:50S ribosomal protein L16 n=1 Tax=endosymbiont of Euscepes postfasciatus TaxID=650377 RepID=UPI000DC71E64|nr:50S ribosomal protein L16 [endosymbiont of Euscepes postfasciatus]BBA84686.1 50S ribosomal protein L16 [endosymbiont of Euscepes postfasciatus]